TATIVVALITGEGGGPLGTAPGPPTGFAHLLAAAASAGLIVGAHGLWRGSRRAAAVHATDSLAPFAPREDRAFHVAHGGVLAYRTVRGTAIVSGNPIGGRVVFAEPLGASAAASAVDVVAVALARAGARRLSATQARLVAARA
ncbi:MAG: hypothetical protein QOJ63_733, partial [Solirubrobacteraceae bacterium]|nr:hypothetical protein [Solirubrobacteraceae bacterium]